jgi:hypothetical protein
MQYKNLEIASRQNYPPPICEPRVRYWREEKLARPPSDRRPFYADPLCVNCIVGGGLPFAAGSALGSWFRSHRADASGAAPRRPDLDPGRCEWSVDSWGPPCKHGCGRRSLASAARKARGGGAGAAREGRGEARGASGTRTAGCALSREQAGAAAPGGAARPPIRRCCAAAAGASFPGAPGGAGVASLVGWPGLRAAAGPRWQPRRPGLSRSPPLGPPSDDVAGRDAGRPRPAAERSGWPARDEL